MQERPSRIPKSAEGENLRKKIDSGETHDKVAGSDPAAAPLETDAEAGGTATSPRAIRIAIDQQTRKPPRPPENAINRGKKHNPFALVYLALVIVSFTALIAAVW
jgi:hypothetical protein